MTPLASESEWETDPELIALRAEFVASFEARRRGLETALPALRGEGAEFAAAFGKVVEIAHKLAGAAGSYGFGALTQAASAFEDWAGLRESGHDPDIARAGVELMIEMLERSAAVGKDVTEFVDDPRLRALQNASARR